MCYTIESEGEGPDVIFHSLTKLSIILLVSSSSPRLLFPPYSSLYLLMEWHLIELGELFSFFELVSFPFHSSGCTGYQIDDILLINQHNTTK